ncbi:hypothetical protein THII_0320 [Thioploca ingrica]|uniref:Uncharacterized protein n=1 Tax=Thioploca ingrica TaxID=40754 RepID=A0A090AH75_9GAMM|nr:hypothetical protein THII_0320 [Thioploca ingrica]
MAVTPIFIMGGNAHSTWLEGVLRDDLFSKYSGKNGYKFDDIVGDWFESFRFQKGGRRNSTVNPYSSSGRI